MAGAGYKLFNTGDVLTAAQVNTYLMEQTVMVFADAAARTTALTGVVSEGMISYLKDTNAVEVYDGSNWVASDDPNAIQNSIIDAKGDLIAGTADNTPARLAVGNDGDTLLADSAATTGLRWQADFSAGKNKIINGDFYWNQRQGSSITASGYIFDRFLYTIAGDGTATYSAQTFTPGTAPVAGYEAVNYARIVTTSQTTSAVRTQLGQNIEDVRTFAGQTVTVSFWAKAASGTPKIAVELRQDFGSGGSSAVNTLAGQITLSTSWARYSLTASVPSVSGKTIGSVSLLALNLWVSAGSDFNTRTGTLGIQSNTFEIWGVQAESGSVATAFQTATGTLQGELAACQRYYYRQTADATAVYAHLGQARGDSATVSIGQTVLPVTMRVTPTSLDASNVAVTDGAAVYAATSLSIATNQCDAKFAAYQLNHASGVTQFRYYYVVSNNNSAGYLGFSAEL